jgi:Ca2+:H+ antiporter
MAAGGEEASGLARDTVFAAVMIILNGIIGLCLLVGGLMHREQSFSLDGVSAALVALGAIVILTLVFPNYTVTTPGPYYSSSQLGLIGIVTVVIYGTFVFTQTIGHRQYFLQDDDTDKSAQHPAPPSNAMTAVSSILLLLCLAAVVLLAKKLAPSLEAAVMRLGAPDAVVGVIIAAIILLPEGLAALRAARANRLQTSLNLALGSALASIGLTIPTVSFLSLLNLRCCSCSRCSWWWWRCAPGARSSFTGSCCSPCSWCIYSPPSCPDRSRPPGRPANESLLGSPRRQRPESPPAESCDPAPRIRIRS